jgi:tetratricopeptide (TPR) repeat protein
MKLEALNSYADLRQRQGNHSGAVVFAEESYNILVVAYDCVHPEVQKAAGKLINSLTEKGDLFNAERFAQVTYSNLKDPKNGMDQESESMAEGSYNLASVIHRQGGDLIKAEKLAREALRIRNQLCGSSHMYTGLSCILVARILDSQGKLDNETKELYERSLAILVRNEGPNGANTAVVNTDIGQFYHKLGRAESDSDKKKTQLLLAKSYFIEAVRILSQIFGSKHPNTVTAIYLLNRVLKDLV